MKVVLCFIFIFLFSCTKKPFPGDIIEPNKMADVFWDVVRADVYASEYLRADTTKSPVTQNIILQKKVLAKYGISKEVYEKSFDFYAKQPQLMTALLDTILAREKRLVSIKDNKKLMHE